MKNKIQSVFVLIILLLNFGMVSCTDNNEGIGYINIDYEEIVLYQGEKITIDVDSSFPSSDLVWTSSNPIVVSIHDNRIVGVSRGETIIEVKDKNNKYQDSFKIIVKQHVSNVSLVNNVSQIGIGIPYKLELDFFPMTADNKNVIFTSNDESVATVDNNGLVTGISAGQVMISVKTEDGNKTDSILLEVVDDFTYSITSNFISTFLNANRNDSYNIMLNYSQGDYKKGIYYDSQSLNLSWENDGSTEYKVVISENSDFSNAIEVTVYDNVLREGILIPGKSYYVKVTGNTGILFNNKITLKNNEVRFLNVNGVANVRDLGGYITESGKTVCYNKIFRGAELEGVNGSSATALGKSILKDIIGVKTEIDLRNNSEISTLTQKGISTNSLQITRLFKPILEYSFIIPEETEEKLHSSDSYFHSASATYLKSIFECLADESNYPVYFHCVWGADRTGTLAFLINGLLGVKYEDLVKDFELTTFSHSGKRSCVVDANDLAKSTYYKNYTAEDLKTMKSSNLYKLYWQLMTHYGTESDKLSDAIENYLIEVCKVDKTNIDKFRNIMLK